MNIDDFGIFFQNFEIYHFSKKNLKISLFKISKCRFFFQNQNFQNSKFASDHTETFPDAPVQPKKVYWNQPQNFSPAALLLPRVPPPFLDVSQRSGSFTEHPLLGGCFLRGSEKIQMREFFDFQIFNFQIFRFGSFQNTVKKRQIIKSDQDWCFRYCTEGFRSICVSNSKSSYFFSIFEFLVNF